DGRIDGVVITFIDISRRKEAQQEIEFMLKLEQAAREKAEHSDHLKDDFLAILSHELRSPLNSILGWLRFLRNGKTDEDSIAHAYEVMERSVRLQRRLIEDLLDISRISSGKLRLQLRPVSLAEIVESALDIVRPTAEAKSIRLCSSFNNNVGRILGDP